jgi:hypothetical protein
MSHQLNVSRFFQDGRQSQARNSMILDKDHSDLTHDIFPDGFN